MDGFVEEVIKYATQLAVLHILSVANSIVYHATPTVNVRGSDKSYSNWQENKRAPANHL